MAEVRVKEGEANRSTALERRGGFDPFHRMQQVMQDMFGAFRPFSPFLESPYGMEQRGAERMWVPAFDVKERNDAYVIEADLPGVKDGAIDISLVGNRLTIAGKREASNEDRNEQYYSYEREYGSFVRSFTLPENVDTEHLSADFDNGVLSVVIPKKEAAKPRKISLKERVKALKS